MKQQQMPATATFIQQKLLRQCKLIAHHKVKQNTSKSKTTLTAYVILAFNVGALCHQRQDFIRAAILRGCQKLISLKRCKH